MLSEAMLPSLEIFFSSTIVLMEPIQRELDAMLQEYETVVKPAVAAAAPEGICLLSEKQSFH
jgi:hypothetical protein